MWFAFLVSLGVVVSGGAYFHARGGRRRALHAIAQRIAGQVQLGEHKVTGRLGATPVSLRVIKHGGWAVTAGHHTTEIVALAEAAHRLEFRVCRGADPEAGLLLPTGDDRFDGEFCVSGVPGDVVPWVFTPALRRRMLAFLPGSQWTLSFASNQARLEVDGALWDGAQAGDALELVAAVAAEVVGAHATADAQLATARPSTPYRDAHDQSVVRAVQQLRADELADLDRRRADLNRLKRWAPVVLVLLGVFAVIAYARAP